MKDGAGGLLDTRSPLGRRSAGKALREGAQPLGNAGKQPLFQCGQHLGDCQQKRVGTRRFQGRSLPLAEDAGGAGIQRVVHNGRTCIEFRKFATPAQRSLRPVAHCPGPVRGHAAAYRDAKVSQYGEAVLASDKRKEEVVSGALARSKCWILRRCCRVLRHDVPGRHGADVLRHFGIAAIWWSFCPQDPGLGIGAVSAYLGREALLALNLKDQGIKIITSSNGLRYRHRAVPAGVMAKLGLDYEPRVNPR